jgi:DNA (cytosine-5)-methyltransferase 1
MGMLRRRHSPVGAHTGRKAPAPALLNESAKPRPAPQFIEWVMGLPPGWVTAPEHELTDNQQITALGNGVLPLQAVQSIPTSWTCRRQPALAW